MQVRNRKCKYSYNENVFIDENYLSYYLLGNLADEIIKYYSVYSELNENGTINTSGKFNKNYGKKMLDSAVQNMRKAQSGKHIGQNNGNAKIKDSDAIFIRNEWGTGKYTKKIQLYYELKKEGYKLTKYSFLDLLSGRTYKHLLNENDRQDNFAIHS
jgi:hypothetical protein